MTKVLPNFLVIGVEKGGTTWLYAQLKKHPNIFLSETKEIHFFNDKNSNLLARNNFEQGIEWYQRFFRTHQNEKAIGDITPMYICDEYAPNRIKEILPDAKIIVMLRNPIDRAYSHYWMARNKNHIDKSFDEVIQEKTPKIIKRGFYAKQLKVYFDLFPKENIKVLFFEEVFKKTELTLSELSEFIGVEADFYLNNDSVNEKVFGASSYKSPWLLNIQSKLVKSLRHNKYTGLIVDYVKKIGVADKIKNFNRVAEKYEKIKPEQRDKLRIVFKEDVKELEQMLNRKFDFWDI